MITIRTKSGDVVHGETHDELVTNLYAASRGWHTSEQQYMRRVATRVRLWNGALIRRGTAEKFIKDLQAAGIVTQLSSRTEGGI